MSITRFGHNYSILFHEDDTLYIVVKTKDDVIEFDGRNGNIIDASSFEDESEEYRDTLDNLYEAAMNFFSDWGIDEDTAMSICDVLTPWFAKYAIKEPQPDAWLKVLEDRVEELRKKTEMHEDNINRAIAQFREWVSTASDFDIYYGAEEHGKRVTSVRETYKAVWNEFHKAEAELENYKETVQG